MGHVCCWRRPSPTLFLFLFSSLTFQLSSATIEVLGSRIHTGEPSEIRIFKHLVPRYCHNSFETIQCFDKCRDDPQIERAKQRITEEEHVEQYVNVVVSTSLRLDKEEREYAKRVGSKKPNEPWYPGRGIPCSNKCETDPLYWSCIADCDANDHTAFWKDRCFTDRDTVNGIEDRPCNTNVTDFLFVAECKRCIVNATRKRLKHSCEIAYLPSVVVKGENLCEKMETCDMDMGSDNNDKEDINSQVDYCANEFKDNLEKMQVCINDKIMYAQRECCYSESIRNFTQCQSQGDNKEQCDDEVCMKILSPRLCREKCTKFKNPATKECFEKLCDFFYSLDPHICDHCDNSTGSFQDDLKCVESCRDSMTCVEACLHSPPDYLTQNCQNQDYLANFSSFVLANRMKHYWPLYIPFSELPYSGWPYHYKLPFECGNYMCQGKDTMKLEVNQVEDLCKQNPFRVIDLLACVMVQADPDLVTLNTKVVIENKQFIDCIKDPEYKVTKANLFKLMYAYEVERVCTLKYCQNGNVDKEPSEHPNVYSNVKCRIFGCQEDGHSPYCLPQPDGHVIDLEDHSVCRWTVDFSLAEDPYRLWSTYFDELYPAEIKGKLEYPDATTILSQAMFEGRKDYYTFPYFVIIRSICQGDYYSNDNYNYIAPGNSPVVELKYVTFTNRHWPRNLFQVFFKTALIDIDRISNDKQLVKENPRRRRVMIDNKLVPIGCPDNICYPAFAAPLVFIGVPKFTLIVLEKDSVSLYSRSIYTSQFHSRAVPGLGAIYDPGEKESKEIQFEGTKYGPSKPPAHPGHLFPLERSTFAVDSELNYHQNCIANHVTDKQSNEYAQRKCPELEHFLDDFDNPYEKNVFSPLDAEDIFRSQYTYGTAPTQAIAGFYDPKYIIIGDADMNKIDLVDWSKLLSNLEANETLISCIQHGFKNREHRKPIYSQLDRTDSTYPIKFYRMRYAPKRFLYDYDEAGNYQVPDTAIFEAIGLRDRLLLITTKGVVSFYGHSNATVTKDKAFKFEYKELLNKCFKIVRILPWAQPNSDLIVGITYDYVLQKNVSITNASIKNVTLADDKDRFIDVAQEIWVGRFTNPGEEIRWKQIKSRPKDNLYIDNIDDLPVPKQKGGFGPFKPNKDPGLGQDMREANPRSQIEAICYKTFKTELNYHKYTKNKLRLVEEAGWCSALDATPVQLKENSIQVLVRMRTYYNADNTKMYFYIVATHQIIKFEADVTWIIDSVIPRYPCVDEHLESVQHVTAFNERYFKTFQRGSTSVVGCHAVHEDRLDFHIFLHGMTYARGLSNHLFLYGSRLLQSFNNGRNFVIIKKGFPQRFHEFSKIGFFGGSKNIDTSEITANDIKKNRPVHRIIKMAFDDGGHYAFLTNKLELWFGSTGAHLTLRLRPSSFQSMVQMGLSQVRNIHDGVPFNLDFDSNNRLYEMVAIVGEKGHVTRIMKRSVNEWKILKAKRLLEKFEEEGNRMYRQRVKNKKLTTDLQTPFNYDIAKWSTLCAYRSPSLRQNFSKIHSRTRASYFPHPEQHLNWGKAHREASLLAFQAITFTLVWESYYVSLNRSYAGEDKDPYISWVTNKKFAAFSTMKTTLFSQQYPPEEHSILIQPLKYKRVILIKSHSELLRHYYLDYNVTAELRLEFSIRNDHSVFSTEFKEGQIDTLGINVENSNGSIIQINTEKEVHAHEAAVLFIIKISVKRKSGLSQTFPGERISPVPVTFHLVGAFGNCIQDRSAGIFGDKIDALIMVGCPPNKDFVFDWNATLNSIRLRGDRVENKKRIPHGIGSYCYKEEYVCFFARSPATLHFEIYDETKQRFFPYTGKFIMRIVGGGRTRDSIRKYSNEEIDAFNVVGVSDASLIWSEWDPINHQKVDRRSEMYIDSDGNEVLRGDSRESVLQSGVSVVSWVCHTLSPCARIAPTSNFEVVFWFRVFISNRDVDADTLCLYEKEFDVMLYGFPPSPEFKLLATLGFFFVMVGVMYIVYICSRDDRRVWIATKENTKNWYYIVKDAIPKKLRYYELPLPEEPERVTKHRKFHRFGSDGRPSHESSTSIEEKVSDDDSLADRSSISSTTLDSPGNSEIASSHVLPSINKLHATTKQIMYDQILARRLNSIVERNRALRANLIKRASVPMIEADFEQETSFRRQFGRTVSQESVFTPPMPKDKKRGIDSFL